LSELPAPSLPPSSLNLLFVALSLFFFASLISSLYIYRCRSDPKPIVPYREIWRLPPLFRNLLLFTVTGSLFFISGIFLALLKPGKYPIGFVLQHLPLALEPLPIGVICFIAYILSIKLDIPSLIAPLFLYYILIIAPPNVVSVFLGFFWVISGISNS
jgi:hypothetical protein